MSTLELYYQDAYMADFDAKVLEAAKKGDTVDIVLDQTAFFPEAGGQCCDIGYIGELPVLKVTIQDNIITHSCSINTCCPVPGKNVKCRINFKKRFSNMQQHTGEHIFSGFVKKHFNYENVGFHLSENIVTMDYSGPLSLSDITFLENLSNEAIYENHEIFQYFPCKEELSGIDYRSKLELSEMERIRLVEIKDVDICACCAPHVRSTGEVGILKVIDSISYKGGVRLSILCGERALSDYQNKHNHLLTLSKQLSSQTNEIPKAVEKLKEKIDQQKLRLTALESQILESQVKEAVSSLPENDYILIFTDVEDKILLRNRVNALMEDYIKTIFAFNGKDNSYSFILASGSGDTERILSDMKSCLEIKGGGKAPMFQGTCSGTKSEITDAIRKIFRG